MTITSGAALVTGANKGIGLEIARPLGDGGMIVLLGVPLTDQTDGPPGQASTGAVRRIFEINFVGTLAVT